jgi:hypothetical protein
MSTNAAFINEGQAELNTLTNTLNSGETLSLGTFLVSNNRRYALYLTDNCNLLVETGSWVEVDHNVGFLAYSWPVWDTNTASLPVSRRPVRADMQEDGNFVLHDAAYYSVWATETDGHPTARLVLEDDGSLVVYDRNDKPLWNSGM